MIRVYDHKRTAAHPKSWLHLRLSQLLGWVKQCPRQERSAKAMSLSFHSTSKNIFFWIISCCVTDRTSSTQSRRSVLNFKRLLSWIISRASRHGLEVPKFVFMAVGFETCCNASRMAQLITFSVKSPPTDIPLNFEKLNISPSQQDTNCALHLKMTPCWFKQWQGFGQPCLTFYCCVIWNTTDRTISIWIHSDRNHIPGAHAWGPQKLE